MISIVSCNTLYGVCGHNIDLNKWNSNSPSPSSDFQLSQSHIFTRHGNPTMSGDQLC